MSLAELHRAVRAVDPTTVRSRSLSALVVPGVAVNTSSVYISSGSRATWNRRVARQRRPGQPESNETLATRTQ